MFNFEENALVTISPDFPAPTCGSTRFRWKMHCPLPFVFPSNHSVSLDFQRDGYSFKLEYYNNVDQITLFSDKPASVPAVHLVPMLREGEHEDKPPAGISRARAHLQSVVVVTQQEEYPSSKNAFEGADRKIRTCFDFIGQNLASLQRSLPYMVAWTLYPVSIFDVGIVHHAVDHFCSKNSQWSLIGCGIALSMARQLRAPLFVTDLQSPIDEQDEQSLAHELLSEAQVALFRRQLRLTVINSFIAVETFANFAYGYIRKNQLMKWGVPEAQATSIAEAERKKHRTDEKYLFGEGIKQAAGRSLIEDNKQLYDDLLNLESTVRHRVAHFGANPSLVDAKQCFRTCCEGVRWLSEVTGLNVKPLHPPLEWSIGAIKVGSAHPYTCSPADMELLRRMFGILQPPEKAPPE